MVILHSRIVLMLSILVMFGACTQSNNYAPVTKRGEVSPQPKVSQTSQAPFDPYDPLVAHMLARKQVDPNHISKRNAYVHSTDEYPQYRGKKELRVTRFAPPLPPPLPERKADVIRPQQKPDLLNKISFSTPATVKPQLKNSLTVERLNLRARGAAIEAVRLGNHPDKTRIVVDVSRDVPFRAWLQDENHVLIMWVADSHIATERGRVIKNHPLVKAYGFRQGDNGGQEFIVTFRKPVNLEYKAKLNPNDANENYRIVLDVKA